MSEIVSSNGNGIAHDGMPIAPPEFTLDTPPIASPAESPSASSEQVAANRANAQHSTGTRTDEGKARSSQNALKHGLFSNAMAHPAESLGEERAVFDAIVADGRRRYRPLGAEEELIVDRLAALWWDLQRHATQKQKYLRDLIAGGTPPAEALLKCAPLDAAEARLTRQIRRERDDLVFLQRYRRGDHCKHTSAELAAHERMLNSLERQHDLAERAAAAHAAELEFAEQRLAKAKRAPHAKASPARADAHRPASPSPQRAQSRTVDSRGRSGS